MRLELFKQSHCQSAREHAIASGMTINDQYASAVIFNNVADNFCAASYRAIQGNQDWLDRTLKPHNNVKGISDILGFSPANPEFGFKPRVNKQGTQGDETEIDMAFGNCFVEAKLTEMDFTDKRIDEVLKYTGLSEHFHVDILPSENDKFQNYQLIRNLLAAIQHGKKHILMCDERRQDLAMKYMQTVSCLSDPLHRKSCRVVFWQDLQRASGRELIEFLSLKYGIQ